MGSDELAVAAAVVVCNYSVCLYKIIVYLKQYTYTIFEALSCFFYYYF